MNTEKEEGIILTGYAEFALNEYREAMAEQEKTCVEAGYTHTVDAENYPMRVTVCPNTTQIGVFDEDGELGGLTIYLGGSTTVDMKMQRTISADFLKKLIRKAEAVFDRYLRAFRACTGGAAGVAVNSIITEKLNQ